MKPRLVMDVATLTGAMSVALGTPATGVFSRKTRDWDTLARAGSVSGDRVWRMPLWKSYNDKMKKSPLADLNNISLTPGIKPKIVQRLHWDNYSGVCSRLKHLFLGGGACTAAGFLSNFTNCPSWMHLDIAGVMDNTGGEVKYLSNGMSGRPTRTMVNFVENL